MYYTYFIQSDSFGRHYKDMGKRLKEHNSGQTRSTKPFAPWRLVYYEEFDTFAEARAREKYFKTAAGRRFLNNKLGPVVQRIE